MSEADNLTRSRRVFRLAARIMRGGIRRIYALALILLIGWVTWRAFRYLITALLTPATVPSQIAAIPARLTESVMATSRAEWAGLTSAEHARQPLAHYHRIDAWIQPDLHNNCTTSGCHNPLPHERRKEVRAFLNMHATSIHCGVCHMDSRENPLPLLWYDLRNGSRRDAPAVLRAYAVLLGLKDQHGKENEGAIPAREEIVELIRATAQETNGALNLAELSRHFSAVRLGSEAFDRLVPAALAELPRHFRGEYGAKLALLDPESGGPLVAHPNTGQVVAEFLQIDDEERRQAMVPALHPQRRATPRVCNDCHAEEATMIDFPALGYPPRRVQELTNPAAVRMISRIGAGEPFYLPQFIGPIGSQKHPEPGAPKAVPVEP